MTGYSYGPGGRSEAADSCPPPLARALATESSVPQRLSHRTVRLVAAAGPVLVSPVAAVGSAAVPALRGLALRAPVAGALSGLVRVVVEAQAQPDALPFHIDIDHLDPNHLTGSDDVVRIRDEPVGHRRHVHETVLVHTDVDERAEGRHIGDHPLEHHAHLEVGDRLHPV